MALGSARLPYEFHWVHPLQQVIYQQDAVWAVPNAQIRWMDLVLISHGYVATYNHIPISYGQIYNINVGSGIDVAEYRGNNSVYCDFLNTYGVWPNPDQSTPSDGSPQTANYKAGITRNDTYTLTASSDNSMQIYIGGSLIMSESGFDHTQSTTIPLTIGEVDIQIVAENVDAGSPGLFAAALYDSAGNLVWSTLPRSGLSISGDSGSWSVPDGIRETAYNGGHGGRAGDEGGSGGGGGGGAATFLKINGAVVAVAAGGGGGGGAGQHSNGLPNQGYVSSDSTQGGHGEDKTHGGEHPHPCCVVATALTTQGAWSINEHQDLVNWSFDTLDRSFIGERLHRGYHIIGPKVLIPMLCSDTLWSKYIEWSFTNATNMLKGKKYSVWSIPNSLPWLAAMTVVGLCVTKRYARRTWVSMYRKMKK